ncbi:hypothetical protein [Selenomonas ruminantium]|nr:hypothetical protein [Selenomonas ruminantium]
MMQKLWKKLAMAAVVCGAMGLWSGTTEAAVAQAGNPFAVAITGQVQQYDLSVGIDGLPTEDLLTPAQRRRIEMERRRREMERRRRYHRPPPPPPRRHGPPPPHMRRHYPPPPPPRRHYPPPPRRHWSVDTNITNSVFQLPSGATASVMD